MSDSVLVIGGGGREHSLAWKLAQSDSIRIVFVSPGNAGTALHGAKIRNISLDFTNHSTVAAWCRDYGVQLVVIGPEDPLANGLADDLKNEGIMCLGPGKMAAMIESSKEFAKGFMDRHGIPTARWKSFSDPESAKQHILSAPYPALVIKASGLAAGKGVIVAQTKTEACQAVDSILQDKIFGSAGDVVIIEELLTGDEISVLAFSDGENVALMPPAQDHKRLCDGDAGPNTGGMGSVCPYTSVTAAEMETIRKDIIMTTVHGLKREGRPFVGVLFAGIMLTETGPRVLEFNCRFGDPETQVILPILDCDLYPILLACVKGYLKKCTPKWKDGTYAVGVVLASGGYPGSYAKGKEISGLNDVLCQRHLVFHAGTTIKEEDVILTSGGRVLVVVALGNDLALTIQQAQAAAQLVQFEGKQYRKDIGHRALIKLGREGQGLTYRACGVDITAGDNLIEAIRPMAVTTLRSGVTGTIGGFAGAFDLRAAGYNDPILVSGTDGVGTKLKIAEEVNIHDTIGIDLVAMCVNDILANGAEPLFFLDYFACGKLDVQVAQKVISGIAKGCRLAGCALVGGETAEMPGMYSPGVYDLAGFAVGAVHRDGQLPRVDTIREGDVVIGVASSGLHSNGFSLVRKIVHTQQLNYTSPSPFSLGKTLGDELLTPTKIYTKTLLPVIRSGLVKAYAHITGGGIVENIPRVMPASMGAELDAKSWSVPAVFGWLSAAGGIQDSEMLRVFNCGIGAVMIADRQHAESIIRDAQAAGEMAWSIGRVIRITEGEPRLTVVNLREALRNGHGSSFRSSVPTMPSVPIKKVGVLVSGSGTNLQALLDHTLNPSRKSSARIVIVVSNVPGAMGLERAQRANVPTMVINHKDYKSRVDFDMEVHRNLIEAGVEIVCLAGFMRILSGEFVRLWHGKLINIHPALLPSFKGTHAHRQALEAGVRVTGCTVHFVVEEVDAGAILVQEVVAVEVGDTEETLQERVKTVEHVAYPKALELLASGKAALGQDGRVLWM